MKIRFLGVGSATDERFANCSLILEHKDKNMLLDCGYSIPRELWKHNSDSDYIDYIWISHQHADHYFGLAPLFVRWKSHHYQRTKPVFIFCQKGLRKIIEDSIENGYPGTLESVNFEINWIEFENEAEFEGMKMTIAPTIHPVSTRALRVETDGKTFVYSSDGMYTDESKAIYKDADLLVQETFTLEENVQGHCTVKAIADISDEINVKKIACVHFRNDARNEETLRYLENSGKNLILPKDGDVISL